MELALDGAFWDAFVRDRWEKEATVIPYRPLLTEAELMDGVVAASDAWRSGERVSLAFHLEHGLQQANVERFLPKERDATEWLARVAKQSDGRDFMFGMSGFQVYAPDVWMRVCAFLEGLVDRVGIPGKGAELEVFLGKYESTPFGIHRDTASNFMLVVAGRKRIAVWPREYFRTNVRSPAWIHQSVDPSTIDEHGRDAQILEGGPGDLIYWPSSHWHASMPESGVSMAVAIALLLDAPTSRLAYALVDELEESRFRTLRDEQPFEEAAAMLSHARHLAQRTWLKRWTAFGFTRVPPPEQTSELPSVVERRAPARIEWREQEEGVIAASQGHVIETTQEVVPLLEKLRTEPVETVARSPAECRFLQQLQALRTLR